MLCPRWLNYTRNIAWNLTMIDGAFLWWLFGCMADFLRSLYELLFFPNVKLKAVDMCFPSRCVMMYTLDSPPEVLISICKKCVTRIICSFPIPGNPWASLTSTASNVNVHTGESISFPPKKSQSLHAPKICPNVPVSLFHAGTSKKSQYLTSTSARGSANWR